MIKLHSYQNKVVQFMKDVEKDYNSAGMINLEMGLGKTFISLGLIFEEIENIEKTLIVVPKSLLHNWEQEYNRFQEGRDRISFKNYYRLDKSEQTFKENIILTTYDTIRLNYDFLNVEFGRIILDESQNIRNHKNRISKQVVKLNGNKRWCLSGTPFFNDYSDMYAQCLFLDKAPYNNKKCWRNPTEEFLEEFRKEFCYILKKKDVFKDNEELKLPPIEHINVKIKLSEKEGRIYNKFKDMLNEGGNTLNYLIKIRQTCCNTKVMTKVNNYCSLCTDITYNHYKCGHSLCDECVDNKMRPEKYMRRHRCDICKIDSTKFKKILEIINEMEEDEKIVIFTQWKNMADLLIKFLKKNNQKTCYINGGVTLKRRNDIIDKFETNDKKILIATIQTCGVGINITRANHVILLDSWWNASLENQAIDRLYRLGQKREVYVYHLTMKNTIERWINFKQRQKKIQTKILFEKNNKDYKWLGQSYGIYSERRSNKTDPNGLRSVSRFYNEKKMSKLMLSSCLDRDKIYSTKILVSKESFKTDFPILTSKIFYKRNETTAWEIRNIAAYKIQNYLKKITFGKKQVIATKESLYHKFPDDLTNLLLSFIHHNKTIEIDL